MKKDITNRNDIEKLVNDFYSKVKENPIIGYIFTDVAKIDWEHHLPRMYDFWETTLFGKPLFKGNPMIKHIMLSKKTLINTEHFQTWLNLWHTTIDENFEGNKANEAKQKSINIGSLMLYKIENT